jgi:OOP family OmpA-OmpF porin
MYQGSLLYNVPFADRNSVSFRLGYGKLRPRAGCTVDGATACPRFGALVGGVGARVALSPMFAVRGETFIRSRSSYDFTSVGLTLGISALLGRAGSDPRADLDDDLDGVLNRKDKCPGTVRGALVDVRGCPTDSDGDGVLDGIDRCPATPKGTPVDRFGCPIRRPE